MPSYYTFLILLNSLILSTSSNFTNIQFKFYHALLNFFISQFSKKNCTRKNFKTHETLNTDKSLLLLCFPVILKFLNFKSLLLSSRP